MSERAYTVNEISYMRQCLRAINIRPNVSYFPQEMDARIEEQLRTHIMAKTTPEELEKQASDIYRMDQEMELRRVEHFYLNDPFKHPIWKEMGQWLYGRHEDRP